MKRWQWALIAVALLGVGLWIGRSEPRPTDLTFLQIGQGDATVFRHAGTTIVIDTGPETSANRLLLPGLRKLGVRHVDFVFLSHPDGDHIGGTELLLRRFPSAKLIVSHVFQEHPDLLEKLRTWDRKPSDVLWFEGDHELSFGDARIRTWCPPWEPPANDNDGSMFVRISVGSAAAVLTGDASTGVEQLAILEGGWQAQVLKAGHHGSRFSTSPEWLAAVEPKWVILSSGRTNRYGHPSPDVLARIRAADAVALRTDWDGSIRFVATPEGFRPERDDFARRSP